MTKIKNNATINCFAQAVHLQQKESKMTVSYAQLTFVHRLVTNFYGKGFQHHHSARRVLEQIGGTDYLQEVSSSLPPQDRAAKNMLANISFIWWRLTADTKARDRASNVWTDLCDDNELGIHAISMLSHIALMDNESSASQIRERIVQLRTARQQTTDVERANRLAVLARKLGELYFRRCKEDK